MYFYEALRLGAMLGPQVFGKLSDGTGTCAFGAAHLAEGGSLDELKHSSFCYLDKYSPHLVWPELDKFPRDCPECGRYDGTKSGVGIISVHLNDKHRWTRNQIADWAETQTKRLIDEGLIKAETLDESLVGSAL